MASCGSAEKTPDPTGSGKVARGWPGKGLPFREEWEDESRGLGGSSQKEKRHGRTPDPLAPSQGDSALPRDLAWRRFWWP